MNEVSIFRTRNPTAHSELDGIEEGTHVKEGPKPERISVHFGPMFPEHGLPCICVLANVAVEPTGRDRPRKFTQRAGSGSPEEPEDLEDDQRDKEDGQPEERRPEHPQGG